MKTYIYAILFITLHVLVLPGSHSAYAQQTEKDILHNMLTNFLDGASINDYETHNQFWAEDLIYTGSDGDRITKNDILNGLTEPSVDDILPVYHAEEIDIRIYGSTSVVAFRLVANIPLDHSETNIMQFYNTGTFLKRDGQWRAVAWQATRIPE